MTGPTSEPITLGRYALHGEIASGGMATVYFGRLLGPVGFSRVVAVKRMHSHFARDPEFVDMFLDEAQLAARIHHPNVVSTLDVVCEGGEMFIVMEYVRGESLAALIRAARKRAAPIPIPIAAGIMIGVLAGLHAAHEARGERGEPLNIVHRDVSPHNVLVGQDGLTRLVDFGVAKAASRLQVTRGDQLKGKVSYMSPEQLAPGPKSIDRSADLFAAGAVFWELLASRRLFQGDDAGATIAQVLATHVPPLRELRTDVSPSLEAVVRKALRREPHERFPTAEAFSDAIEAAAPKIASARAVGEWVRQLAADVLTHREARVSELESVSMAPGAARPAPPAPSIAPSSAPSVQSAPSGPWPAPAPVPGQLGHGSWPGGAWTPNGAPPPYHPSLTPVSQPSSMQARGGAGAPPSAALGSAPRPSPGAIRPSDTPAPSVAALDAGAQRRGLFAVLIGGVVGLLLLGGGIAFVTLRGPARAPAAAPVAAAGLAAGAEAPPVAGSASAAAEASASPPDAPAPQTVGPEPAPPTAPPATPAPPDDLAPAAAAAKPVAPASTARPDAKASGGAKKPAGAAPPTPAPRPGATSYLPDRP